MVPKHDLDDPIRGEELTGDSGVAVLRRHLLLRRLVLLLSQMKPLEGLSPPCAKAG